MAKALVLISGGLDSLLAAKLIMEQNVSIEGINFFTGFSGDHDYQFRDADAKADSARYTASQLGIKLHLVNVIEEFKPILLHPKYGYGAHLNPCLDCKLFMIQCAKHWQEKHGFDFLVTGEVLGQRPKSQRRDTLPIATKMTNNLLVRPLSAKLLPPTLPEQNGWVKRELFHDISGRGRGKQLNLARQYGFTTFSQPSGGCCLADKNFCSRLSDLLKNRPQGNYTANDILLLRVGRHWRIKADLKVIIGRDAMENQFIQCHSANHLLMQTLDYPGAKILLDGPENSENIQLAAAIAAYFSKGKNENMITVSLKKTNGLDATLNATPLSANEISPTWYL